MHLSLKRLISRTKPDEELAVVNRSLHRFALVTAFSTLCLLVAGALVTSNEAGLSVPAWPLSYGQWMPPMIGGIFYEHGHRMIASFVGLLTIVLACWLASVEHRKWVKNLGWLSLATVILQGVLGGITVLFLLPTVVSVGHACLAQLFFCMVCILALVTSPGWQNRNEDRSYTLPNEGVFSLRRLTIAVNLAIFLQLILGATLRHKAFGVVPHLVGAVTVTLLVVWIVIQVASQYSDEQEILSWTLILNGLLAVQLLLGAATYWIRHVTEFAPQPLPPMVALTVAHLAVGALMLASSVVLTFQIYGRDGRGIAIRARELPQMS